MSNVLRASAVLLALGASAAGAASLSNLDGVDGEALAWGVGNTTVYGQTLSFSEPVLLQSLEVQINDQGVPVTYEMSVWAWEGQAPSGSPLFETTTTSAGIEGFQGQNFDLGNLSLPQGSYVVLFEALSEAAASFASVENSYEGGSWVHQDDPWYISDTVDLGFELTFSAN